MTLGLEIQEQAYRDFEVWLSDQPDEVQEANILDQVAMYAAAQIVDGVLNAIFTNTAEEKAA